MRLRANLIVLAFAVESLRLSMRYPRLRKYPDTASYYSAKEQ